MVTDRNIKYICTYRATHVMLCCSVQPDEHLYWHQDTIREIIIGGASSTGAVHNTTYPFVNDIKAAHI